MKSSYIKFLILSICISPIFHQTAIAQVTSTPVKDTTITLKVAGITCSGDLPIIVKRVKEEKGIVDCSATSKAAAVTIFQVKYTPAIITYDQIVKAVQDAPGCDYPNERPYKVRKKH